MSNKGSGIFISEEDSISEVAILDVGEIRTTPQITTREDNEQLPLSWKTSIDTRKFLQRLQKEKESLQLRMETLAQDGTNSKIVEVFAVRISELRRVLNLIVKDKYELE